MAKITIQIVELLFSIDYGIKSMEFACADDNMYKATFVDETGDVWRFSASRKTVLEHVKMFARYPELYESHKDLIVSHFHHMAMSWYKMTHIPKCALETLT